MSDYFAAIPIGIFLSFMIGPVFFVLLETAITKSVKAALFFDLGVILGDISFILIAYFSSYSLLLKLKDNPKLYLFGGIIMAVYGLISFFQAQKEAQKEAQKSPNISIKETSLLKYSIKGFLLNFMNIGVLGFWLGILINIGPKLDMNGNKIAVYFTLIISGYFVTDLIKINIAKKLQEKLTPKKIIQLKKIVALIIVVFGLFLTIKTQII